MAAIASGLTHLAHRPRRIGIVHSANQRIDHFISLKAISNSRLKVRQVADMMGGWVTCQGRVGCGVWGPLVGVALFLFGCAEADAAYRLTFQNGTSIEVQSYEDLGDAIRYPRLGGTVVVPKSSVSTIEEAVHLPPPTALPSPPSTPRPTTPGLRSDDRPSSPVQAMPRVPTPTIQIPTLPWQRAGDTATVSRTVRVLTGVALLIALVAVVVFFMGNTRTGSWDEREYRAAGSSRTTRREDGGPGAARAERPLGVVLVGIRDVVFGGLTMSMGLWGAVAGQMVAEMPVFLFPAGDPVVIIVLSLGAMVFGVISLAAAYGMWSLQTWGWQLQAAVCFADVLLNAYALLANAPSSVSLFSVAGLFVDSGILIYMSRPGIQKLYERDTRVIEANHTPTTDEEPRIPSL